MIINPRAGQNVVKIADLIAVLSAAGWRTEIALKEFGGQSMELATRAVKANCDLVIGYGGDGTLNQVLNGAMNARKRSSAIGVIPGGTANVWAAEIGVPSDPVKAALALVDSETRKIDIGHVEVQGLVFPGMTHDKQEKGRQKKEKQVSKSPLRATPGAKHHFLLMAGLGLDASIMEHVSKPFKYEVGRLAVGLAAAEELPKQHPFPLEVHVSGGEHEDKMVWEGEALQVIIGNTRRYANIVQMTPGAYLDDGVLDVCVVTAGNALTTLEEIASLLFRRRPDAEATKYFRGASITIRVPASIDLQLDGSAVRLKDYLSKAERKVLQNGGNAEKAIVTYRFNAMPHAVQVAIPSSYNGALFEHPMAEEEPSGASQQQRTEDKTQQCDRDVQEGHQETPELVGRLLEHGYKVTVVGAAAHPGKQHRYIIAGTIPHQMTGDTRAVAIRVNGSATVLTPSGKPVSPGLVQGLQEGTVIVAVGKKSKYGVIRATHLVLP